MMRISTNWIRCVLSIYCKTTYITLTWDKNSIKTKRRSTLPRIITYPNRQKVLLRPKEGQHYQVYYKFNTSLLQITIVNSLKYHFKRGRSTYVRHASPECYGSISVRFVLECSRKGRKWRAIARPWTLSTLPHSHWSKHALRAVRASSPFQSQSVIRCH